MKRTLLPLLLGFLFTAAALAGGSYTWPAPLPPADANPAISPVFPLARWLNTFEEKLQASRKLEKIDLIFDGDQTSIAPNYFGATGEMVARFGKRNAFDFGNAGDPTQTVLWRIQNGQLDGLHPKLVVLMLGSGNLQANTPEQIAEAITAIVQEYQKRCPEATILLQSLFPRMEKPDAPFRVKVKAVNDLIAKLGDGKKVIFLDFSDKFLQPDGMLTKEMFFDFNFPHPTPAAYKIWADAIQPVIDQFVPPVPAESTAKSTAKSTPAPAAAPTESGTGIFSAPIVGGGVVTWPSAPVPAGGNSAIIPEPPMAWLNQFAKKIADSHKMPSVDLLFDGDSITAGWMGGGGGVWNRRYRKLNAFDFGNSGDVTQGLIWQMENGQADGLHPKLIVLLIGTNNLGHGTPEMISDGIKAVVGEYQKHCPGSPILLQGIFPRGEKPDDAYRAKIKAINAILAKYADGKKVIFLDFGDKFLQPDGTISKEIMPDFLHPSPKGYEIWADAIQPVVHQFIPPASTPAGAVTPAASAPAATTPTPAAR